METINYMENIQLNVSVKEDISNLINISFKNIVNHFYLFLKIVILMKLNY